MRLIDREAGGQPERVTSGDPVAMSGRGHGGVGPPSGFRVAVVAARQLTPTVHAIEVGKPATFGFRAIQFTFLQVRTEVGLDARPMSLATSPTRPHLEYAARTSDSPFKRAFVALRPGDEVGVFGPIGDFVLDETRPAVLVAGGIGITPLKGMAEYAADLALPIPIRLIYSNRSEDEVAYRDELATLENHNHRFRVLHTLTGAPGPGWPGTVGRIDDHLLQQAAFDLEEPVHYVSGTPGFVVSVWRLLRAAGIAAEDIRVEAFRGYASAGVGP
ncbi:ferredoxin--NADP reductase [Longispora fulva]|uniref:Ferredoxin-NADP reductase n=1 Tax=Longispora fulva TaxID=619741 RepID=A0A8J7GD05_9ACTN|nr:FAD-dependent oxidoreductase [Longispora fulva]MBG6135770.1 ferredoxin-NADP reductase [Longispora fulva]